MAELQYQANLPFLISLTFSSAKLSCRAESSCQEQQNEEQRDTFTVSCSKFCQQQRQYMCRSYNEHCHMIQQKLQLLRVGSSRSSTQRIGHRACVQGPYWVRGKLQGVKPSSRVEGVHRLSKGAPIHTVPLHQTHQHNLHQGRPFSRSRQSQTSSRFMWTWVLWTSWP